MDHELKRTSTVECPNNTLVPKKGGWGWCILPVVLSTIILICLIAVFSFLGIRKFFSASSDSSTDVSQPPIVRGAVTDVAQYTEIRAQLGDSIAVRHFPQTIPSDATDVRFFYEPGFLQGGTILQLKLKLPANRIDELYSQYRNMAIYTFVGGDTNQANLLDDVPIPFFYASDNDEHSFPATYEIIVLGAEPYGKPDFKWNHGTTYGVAIDKSGSEIVYWLEDW